MIFLSYRTVSVKLCSKRNKLKNIDVLLKLLALTNEGKEIIMHLLN